MNQSPVPTISRVAADLASALVEPILRSVPEWFGIESGTRRYIENAATMPTWVAFADGAPIGFISVKTHYPQAAEIYCMAVHKVWHGRGVGTSMMRIVEEELAASNVLFLQVKTQGPSLPCSEYAQTTRFYRSMGFVELEEMDGIWPGIPALVLIKNVRATPR